jgi:hypothetical protein
MKRFLLVIGLLLFVQTALILEFGLSRPRPNLPEDAQRTESKFDAYLDAIDTKKWLSAALGSEFGCVGAWLLALYLKVRELDRAHGGSTRDKGASNH